MGKSPGKWFKTLLFGKKSTGSQTAKRSASVAKSRDFNEGKGKPALSMDHSMVAEQVPTNHEDSGIYTEDGKSILPLGEQVVLPEHGSVDESGGEVCNAPVGAGKSREEQAATRAQAVFRGYLARRAFRALRGIIKLQALVRGHLVRRQAVATLYCMWGIVKLQAFVRGTRARHDTGFEVKRSYHLSKIQSIDHDVKQTGRLIANFISRMSMFSANAYRCKTSRFKSSGGGDLPEIQAAVNRG